MSVLSWFRRSSKWLVLGAGLACLLVAAVGVVPHDDEDGARCLICKLRQEPLDALPIAGGLEAPTLRIFDSHASESFTLRSIASDSSSPRAPPA